MHAEIAHQSTDVAGIPANSGVFRSLSERAGGVEAVIASRLVAGRMLDYLGPALRDARIRSGLRQLDIATTAGVSDDSVSRLELARAWPMEIDRIVAAYAVETGLEPLDLWATAIECWRNAP